MNTSLAVGNTEMAKVTDEKYAEWYQRVVEELRAKHEAEVRAPLLREIAQLKGVVAFQDSVINSLQARDGLNSRYTLLGIAVQRAGAVLPDEHEVVITVERGAASVHLLLPDGDATIEFDLYDSLTDNINAAIDRSLEAFQ